MRRTKQPTVTIFTEMCVEILSKLPVKSLVRFRCASKLWRSIIDEPYFTSRHLIKCQNNQEKSRLLVIEPPGIFDGKQLCTIRRGDTFRKMSRIGLDITWYEQYQVVGYINGVVCMKKIKAETQVCGVFLMNPCIGKLFELPLPYVANIGSEKTSVDFGFGFDPIRNDYKVITTLYAEGGIHVPQFTELYTLSEDSWRDIHIEKGPCSWSKDGPKAFLNGVTYWIGNGINNTSSSEGKHTHFVSFNASSDAFNYIELPDCEDVNALEHQRFPVVLGQSIALMESFQTRSYIWVMEEFGVTKSWTKQYSINLQLCHRFLHLKTDGELLLVGEREGVISYNIKSQKTTILAKSYKLTPVLTDIYIESLVLLNQVREISLRKFPI